MKYRVKHILEYVGLRVFVVAFSILPYRVALAAAWVLAWFAFHVVRFRVGEAVRRIQDVFGDRYDERQARRIAWRSLRNVGFNLVELMRLRRLGRDWVDRFVDLSEVGIFFETRKPDEGAIFALVHMGNWDLAGLSARHYGFSIFAIARTQKNPLADVLLNRMRSETGIEVVAREDPSLLRKVLRHLKGGDVLAILMDLRSPTPALSIPYLGAHGNLAGGTALFARQAGVPIYPIVTTREGWTGHKWRVHDPVRLDASVDKEADWQRMTEQVMAVFDRAVREHPEQYFWYNKRWVLQPLPPESA